MRTGQRHGLDIRGLRVRFGASEALRGVDVPNLRPGELTALVGPNAAGKSTLLRAVAGMVQHEAGEIRLGQVELSKLRLRRRAEHVRYVPQIFAHSASLPVSDAVVVARMAGRTGRAEARDRKAAGDALARVGAAHLHDRDVTRLSGGQQQLVALAMGLARPAPVLLLDEPTSALDLRHQLETLELARSLARDDGMVVLIAIHDLNLALRHADRVVLLNEGRLVGDGSPLAVIPSESCAAAYRVQLDTARTTRGSMMIEARL